MAMCIFNNCTSVQKPFSSLAFFALPKDHRRRLWIENSGNQELATLSESARRVVCQKHFSPRSLRIQFHRTILSRDAVPDHWSAADDSNIQPIKIPDNDETDNGTQTHLPDKTLKTVYENDCAQQDVNDWQINHENTSADQTEGVLEYEVIDNDENFQTVDECVFDNRSNANDQCQQIYEERVSVDEEPISNQEFYHEDKTETVDLGKRKNMDVVNVAPVKIVKQCSSEPIDKPDKSVHCTAADFIVSSSTNKSDDASGSIPITNEEDKYFALALVGILQRISPQKRAFAKVNIFRYLTELEYGVEARIN